MGWFKRDKSKDLIPEEMRYLDNEEAQRVLIKEKKRNQPFLYAEWDGVTLSSSAAFYTRSTGPK